MGGFDLRFVVPILINLLKSLSEALPWDWDAFNLLKYSNQTSRTKVSLHLFLLLFFSFTSITLVPIRPSPNTALIRFRFGNFSPHITVSLACSLLFPQALFWFTYPVTLMLNHFQGRFNFKFAALPAWNLHISSTLSRHIESEVPVPQVSITVSPEDGDSLAEG